MEEDVSKLIRSRHFEISKIYPRYYDPSKKECESDGHYVAYEHRLIAKLITEYIIQSVKNEMEKENLGYQ